MPVLLSSAPVGSSHSSTSGRLAMARAMATRCCSPPDICAGKVIHAVAEPDQIAARLRRGIGIARDLGDQGDVLARGEARDQVVELEDEADVLAAVGA